MSYYNLITKQGISVKLMPVPRKVSSSCGTCVSYEHSVHIDVDGCELECVYQEVDGALECKLNK
jgi:hypothetical protein